MIGWSPLNAFQWFFTFWPHPKKLQIEKTSLKCLNKCAIKLSRCLFRPNKTKSNKIGRKTNYWIWINFLIRFQLKGKTRIIPSINLCWAEMMRRRRKLINSFSFSFVTESAYFVTFVNKEQVGWTLNLLLTIIYISMRPEILTNLLNYRFKEG